MAWRGVHLSTPARLSLADAQMAVLRDGEEVRLAIEDIAWIVLDTPQATMTSALLSACMEAGVAVVVTDARHTPSGLLLPFHRHHRQAAVAAVQSGTTLPLRKRLWQRIVVAKIENQAGCLVGCGLDPGGLPAMARRIGSGDPDNIEAQAARDVS